MYPTTKTTSGLEFSSYDVSKLGVIFNGQRLGLAFDDRDQVVELLTDGENVLQIHVNVLQGSASEDLLSAQAGSDRLNVCVIQDANDSAGKLNIVAFAVRVCFPYRIAFGADAAVRTFVLQVDNSDDAQEELYDDSFFTEANEQEADEAGFDGFGFYTVDAGSVTYTPCCAY